MHRVFAMCTDAAIAAILLIPLFFLLNRYVVHSRSRSIFYCLFAIYLCGMFAVVGLPDIRYVRFDPKFNFVPFRYMFSDFANSFLNVVLFLPLGFCLPVFWRHYYRMHRTVIFGFCVSMVIEVLQIFTRRASDVNDLITNTFGTLLGWFMARLLLHFVPRIQPGDNTSQIAYICIASFVIMFFIQPFLAGWILL